MKKEIKDLKEEFETDELEDFDFDSTDPIYKLTVFGKDKDDKIITILEVAEFQYLDQAEQAFEKVKGDILEVRDQLDNKNITSMVIELSMMIHDEEVETVERTIFDF